MNKLLWVGDAVVKTGFSTVTHRVLDVLKDKWDVHVLGVNYNGDPTPYQKTYGGLYPAMLGGDVWGVQRINALVNGLKPDVVLIVNDPWNIPPYVNEIPDGVPVVAYCPIDAPNQQAARHLNALARVIAYTGFGRKELVLGGYTGRCEIIGHGVDTDVFHPVDGGRMAARKQLKLSKNLNEDSFIVGNVNRNQPRKRLDLTIQYWTQWWVNAGQPRNAYLYLHCSNNDIGWNVLQLAKYYGMQSQLIITNPNMGPMNNVSEHDLNLIYNAFDVQITTTMGEGWGLTQHEGMAAGTAQIVPEYSALAEWPKDAVRYVPVTSFGAHPQCINTIGGIADAEGFVAAIDEFYTDPSLRDSYGKLALARATEERFKWANVAEQFHAVLLETVLERQSQPVGVKR